MGKGAVKIRRHPDIAERGKVVWAQTDPDQNTLELDDIFYLDGLIYKPREDIYMRALGDDAPLPLDLLEMSVAKFHRSPAANIGEGGGLTLAR